jgi:hypothetical protein
VGGQECSSIIWILKRNEDVYRDDRCEFLPTRTMNRDKDSDGRYNGLNDGDLGTGGERSGEDGVH